MTEEGVQTPNLKEKRKKRVMTPEQLEKLAIARKKALETRAKMSQLRKEEKEAKKKEILSKAREIVKEEVVVEQHKPPERASDPKVKIIEKVHYRTKKATLSDTSSSSSSSSSSLDSDSSYEVKRVVKKRKPRPKRKTVSSKTNEELAYTIAKTELERRIKEQNFNLAAYSLFGGI
jgi:hypothetical protein